MSDVMARRVGDGVLHLTFDRPAKKNALTGALAQKPRLALAAARRLMRGDPGGLRAHAAHEIAAFVEALRGPEAQQRLRALGAARSSV